MNKKTIFTVSKAFQSYKLSSVTKWIHFTELFCFLSNIINCKEQLKTIQQTEKKQKCTSFLGVCIMSSTALGDTISK